ncbi:Stk1 family PASTA domain-containing Ser/Thr kinase [Leucobacter triazinivorans]
MIGQTLDGRYAIRSRIARGGMAMVYLANDLRLERRVAVKVMHEHLAEDENFTRRFEQEARSAARLSHPNLVNVFDQGHDAGRTYLVMEYLPSITLRDLLKQQQHLTAEQAIEIGEAVLSGLAAAHRAGIVHRDLKPENVLLADDGRIKLGDFGLARAVSANTTTGQALLGTIAYLSPELVTRGIADARSDLYAFGIMLYEMLTGSQPFTGEQPMQIAYQHAHSEVPLPSLTSSEATPELDELVRWTTQRDPELRPLDAGDALGYLSPLRHGLAPNASTRVLPELNGELPTPSTTVLDEAQRHALAADAPAAGSAADTAEQPPPATPLELAAVTAQTRSRRGRIMAAVLALLVVLAGGLGWWFGQGPGSQVSVPDVAGAEMAAAEALLDQRTLSFEVFECSSVEVPAGLAARTEPEAGTRLDRGSGVRLCRSTGPEMLPVPTIAGLPLPDAEAVVVDAGFSVGEIDRRFGEETSEIVLAALDAEGEPLGETYPEQAPVDLVVSAGPLPDVVGLSELAATSELDASGLTVEAARSRLAFHGEVERGHVIALLTQEGPVRPGDAVGLDVSAGALPDVGGLDESEAAELLADAELSVDPELRQEAHHDEIPEGRVIAVLPGADPVRPGDTVGLQVSLGPELFEVPGVADLPLREAIAAIESAGFTARTNPIFTGSLLDAAVATGTDPAAGTRVRAGTEIYITGSLFG